MKGAALAAVLGLCAGWAAAQTAGFNSDGSAYASGRRPKSSASKPAEGSTGSAPLPDMKLAPIVGDALGDALGRALSSPGPAPYTHVRPKPVVSDEDDIAPSPAVSAGVGDAQDIIGAFSRAQPDHTSACPSDPNVVCVAQDIPDMSMLGENPIAIADGSLSDAPAEPRRVPTPPQEKKVDDVRDKLAAYWEKFVNGVSLEEIGRLGVKFMDLLPDAAKELSEKIGSGANVIGVIDAKISTDKGENPKAMGTLTGVGVGLISEPVGLGLAACGKINPCAKGAVTGFNVVVGAPFDAGANFHKNIASQSIIQGYQLQYGLTPEQARLKYDQEIDKSASRFKNNSQNESFVNGALGVSK